MDKQLIDKAWRCLPREFREEVKKIYKTQYLRVERIALLCNLFGAHNLTSDAEGEEMLTVPRSKVQEKWQRAYEQEAKYSKTEQNPTTREELYYNRGIMSVIDTLFGSKCLPDNVDSLEPKPAEPKFKVGDYARYKGDVHKVVATTKDNRCYLNKILGSIDESDLEPYNEPKEDKQFDNIIKDSFSKERRLTIATQITASIYSNREAAKQLGSIEAIVRKALDIADTLITESEKGGAQ